MSDNTSTLTMVVFTLYIAGVFVLAIFSHKLLSKRSFLSEYFLGSRGLGTWALAFTFAATSASGGSFGGYPSLIYSYGWVLALWIASYMIFPLTTMGVIGKRLNQVAARTSGAITIPDVFRDRFNSPVLGVISSCIIIFFTICVLIAQFKMGALIIEDTFNMSSRVSNSYLISLLIFAFTVVFYTAYGGFRAVVWTDVMQGIVMGLGVVLLVPIVLSKSGGLEKAAQKQLDQAPMAIASVEGDYNDLVFRFPGDFVPNSVLYAPGSDELSLERTAENFVVHLSVQTNANDIKRAVETDADFSRHISVEIPYKNEAFTEQNGERISLGCNGAILGADGEILTQNKSFAVRHGYDWMFAPGTKNDGQPFHPLGAMISFFFMWAIIGMAQPGMMVRLMAFRNSRTLKRSMLAVTVYYALIYLPLIFVVMAARSILPPLTPEHSDRTIVLVATRLVADMGLGYEVLGAILVAAPFAAVMSTVDSFLLMISSGAVRDIYQRSINPRVSPRTIKFASYATTVLVGAVVTILAQNPPDFLQKIIVFVSGGFAACLMGPMVLGLYWRNMTAQGALAAMLGGLATVLACFIPPMFGHERVDVLGLHPSIWGIVVSFALGILVSKMTRTDPDLVQRYFA